MHVVIPKNTCIPVKMSHQYISTVDSQLNCKIKVYEGERTRAVSATWDASGISNEITITNYKERLSAKEIKKLIREAEKYHIEDKKFVRMAEAVNALDDYIYKMKNTLKKEDINLKLSSEEIKHFEDSIAVATNLVDENKQKVEADVLVDYLKGLETRMEHILAKTI